ncbi:MAG: hypothetical protein ACPKPY_04480 [Nitrososphaeraceae archaeon]
MIFTKGNKNWSCEYEDTVYKIYDWNNNLTGYFFPKYGLNSKDELDDDLIFKMNDKHDIVYGAHVMLPLIKLDVFDRSDFDLEYLLSNFKLNIITIDKWKNWLMENNKKFNILYYSISTAREDRNMLVIVLELDQKYVLGEKYISDVLSGLLDQLHEDGLI